MKSLEKLKMAIQNNNSWKKLMSVCSINTYSHSFIILFLLLTSLISACKPGGEIANLESPVLTITARNNSVVLQWPLVNGAEFYNIYYSDDRNMGKANLSSIRSSTTPLIVESLENNKTYYFAVTAVGVAGESEIAHITSSIPRATPLAPQKLFIRPGSESLTIDWTESIGATKYNLYLTRSPGITLEKIETMAGWMIQRNISKPYVQTGLNNGQNYYVVISAENDSGESSMSDEYSDIPTQMYKMTMGNDHFCAIQSDLTLWCWGRNNKGQLGIGSSENHSIPVAVAPDKRWLDISAGPSRTCGVTTEKSMWCWGNNYEVNSEASQILESNIPVQIQESYQWESISAGQDITCGITSNSKKLICWGNEEYLPDLESVPKVLDEEATWKSVVLSGAHHCAMKTDDTLWCWGKNIVGQTNNGQSNLIESTFYAKNLSRIDDFYGAALGDVATLRLTEYSFFSRFDFADSALNCGIRNNGGLWCWGGISRNYERLDITIDTAWPFNIDINSTWRSVAVGYKNLCAIKQDYTLWCGGSSGNDYVTLVDAYLQQFPTQVIGEKNWESVLSNKDSTCAIKLDGSVWCIGSSKYGQLGSSSSGLESNPVEILSNVGMFSVSNNHVCAYVESRFPEISCWGSNELGQVGDRTQQTRQVPQLIRTNVNIKDIASTKNNNCYLSDVGEMVCWGTFKNRYVETNLSPTPFENEKVWENVALGDINRCAIKNDRTLWCLDDFLAIEDYIKNNTPERLRYKRFTLIESAEGWEQVYIGGNQACAIAIGNSLWCWGVNNYGELGTNDDSSYSVPQKVYSDQLWANVSVGSYHTCGITQNQELWCWGRNDKGQLGDSTLENSNHPVKVVSDIGWLNINVTDDRTCGIKLDNTLWCWGLELPKTVEVETEVLNLYQTPVQVGTRRDWTVVGLGDRFICASNLERILFCWGDNTDGRVGNGKAWISEFHPVQFPVSKAILQ